MTLVRKQAPLFVESAVYKKEFVQVNLDAYRGKWVVLFFYPMDFTFVCPTEIIAMSDAMAEFEKRDTAVLGASVDSQFSHLAWTNIPRNEGGLGDLNFPLIADFSKKIAEDYGVLLPEGMALRSTFIIDPEGVVQFELVHDLSVGRNVKEIIRNLDALKYARIHGEVCPAGWTPGEDTIVPDVEKCKDYFNKNS
jgi:peroxiredoxin (alkyl hydroperoxide reductase subunit C)